MSPRPNLDLPGIAIITLCCLAWGLNQVAIKYTNTGFTSLCGAGLRGVIAASLVLLWARWRGIPIFTRDGTLRAGIVIGVIFGVEFAMVYTALRFTTATHSVVLMYSAPFWVALGAHLFIPTERLTATQVLGLAAAFTGLVVAFGDSLGMPTLDQLFGDALVVLTAMAWAATTILARVTSLSKISPAKVLLYQLAGSCVLLPVAAAIGDPLVTSPSAPAILWLLYQGVVVAFLTYLTWYWLITRYQAAKLASFTFLAPIFGVIAGSMILGEPVSPALAVSLVLVVIGLWLVNRRSAGETAKPARRAEAA